MHRNIFQGLKFFFTFLFSNIDTTHGGSIQKTVSIYFEKKKIYNVSPLTRAVRKKQFICWLDKIVYLGDDGI